jgi:glycosyltransferase involved in cell wall biosynthesis
MTFRVLLIADNNPGVEMYKRGSSFTFQVTDVTRNASITPRENFGVVVVGSRLREILQARINSLIRSPKGTYYGQIERMALYIASLGIYTLKTIITSLNAARELNPDCVVAVWAVPNGLVASVVGVITGRVVIIHTDGGDVDVLLSHVPVVALLRFFTGKGVKLTALDEERAMRLKRLLKSEPSVVRHFGVDTSVFRFFSFEKKRLWKAVAVSRLSEEKDIFTLLKAIILFSDEAREKDFHLFLVGSGPQEEALTKFILKSEIGDIVTIMGFMEHESIPHFLADAAIFILPSRREGMSSALLEGLSVGCVCLVSDIPPNTRIVSHRKNGLVFEKGNEFDLAKCLSEITSNVQLARVLSTEGRRLIETNYTIQEAESTLKDLVAKNIRHET